MFFKYLYKIKITTLTVLFLCSPSVFSVHQEDNETWVANLRTKLHQTDFNDFVGNFILYNEAKVEFEIRNSAMRPMDRPVMDEYNGIQGVIYSRCYQRYSDWKCSDDERQRALNWFHGANGGGYKEALMAILDEYRQAKRRNQIVPDYVCDVIKGISSRDTALSLLALPLDMAGLGNFIHEIFKARHEILYPHRFSNNFYLQEFYSQAEAQNAQRVRQNNAKVTNNNVKQRNGACI